MPTGNAIQSAAPVNASQIGGVTVSGVAANGLPLVATGASTAAWQAVSGQYLCPPTAYAPGSQTPLTTTSATMAAVSSANVNTGSFTAPSSGKVFVDVSLVETQSATGNNSSYGLAAHGTVSPIVGNTVTFNDVGASPRPRLFKFLVTGLTPGTSYNFDLLFAAAAGTTTVDALGVSSTTPTGTQGGPVTMEVRAI